MSDINFYAAEEDDEEMEAEEAMSTSEDSAAADAESATQLTPHEAEVAENNLRLHEHMRKKGAAKAKSFEANEIATLFIPKKQRLVAEQSRITVRILNENSHGYQLLTR